MEKMTYEDKKMYAGMINELFGGAVRATPDQINETICLYVDQMVYDIEKCSKDIASFAFGAFYTFTFAHFTKFAIDYALAKWYPGISLGREISRWLATEGIDTGLNDYLSNWIATLIGNRRFVACVYTARVKWRSKIEIELLGI